MSHVDASRYVKGHADLQVVGVDPPWSAFPASLSESILHGVDPVPATWFPAVLRPLATRLCSAEVSFP